VPGETTTLTDMVTVSSNFDVCSSLILKKVHADSSNFADGVSKTAAYNQVIEQAQSLFDGQRNWVSFVLPLYRTSS
jgi:hypothetical protein